jgi:hypothetical protein
VDKLVLDRLQVLMKDFQTIFVLLDVETELMYQAGLFADLGG